jgi:hypothetical protein
MNYEVVLSLPLRGFRMTNSLKINVTEQQRHSFTIHNSPFTIHNSQFFPNEGLENANAY